VFDSRYPRFRLLSSVIPMFLTKANPLLVDDAAQLNSAESESHVFANIVADFAVVCAHLPRTTTSNIVTKESPFSHPRDIFDLSEVKFTTDPDKVLIYRAQAPLPFQFAGTKHCSKNEAFERFRAQQEMEDVRAGKGVAIFRNGKDASSFDFAVVARNFAIITACKNGKSFSCGQVRDEFEKQENPEVLEMLFRCCAAEGSKEMTIRSVCILASKDSFPTFSEQMGEEWEKMLTETKSDGGRPNTKSPNKKRPKGDSANVTQKKTLLADDQDVTFKIHRHIAYATAARDAKSLNAVCMSNLYPVMSFPLPENNSKKGSSANGPVVNFTCRAQQARVV